MPLPRHQDLLADSVLASSALLSRYLVGFNDQNRTTQAPGLPNHAAWCLGHLSLTMHRACERLGAPPALPSSDFLTDALQGDTDRFGTESVAFGSVPVDDPATYPIWSRCLAIFDAATLRLANTARSASDDALITPRPFFGGTVLPAWQAIPRAIFHNGGHGGQIADLRRALGLGSIFA